MTHKSCINMQLFDLVVFTIEPTNPVIDDICYILTSKHRIPYQKHFDCVIKSHFARKPSSFVILREKYLPRNS